MNVLSWLNSYVMSEIELSPKLKSKLNPDSYFRVLARKERKFIEQTDFSIGLSYVFPSELLKFNEKQKEEIDKLVERFEEKQFFLWLELLSKVLSDFKEAEASDHEIAKVILEAYEYLQLKFKDRFPDIYADFQRIKAKKQEKLKSKQERPNCPSCGSNKIVSNGKTKWLCNSCGRQFKKQC